MKKFLTKNNFIFINEFLYLKNSLSYNYLKQVLYYYFFMINLFILQIVEYKNYLINLLLNNL